LQPTLAVLAPVLSLLGVIVGASLQYLYNRTSENRKHVTALRTAAYVDYLQAVALLGRNRPATSEKFTDALALAANAKTRICIYGSDAVVRQLALFDSDGAVLDNPKAINHFLRLCSVMRSESGHTVAPDLEDHLRTVLFGPEANVLVPNAAPGIEVHTRRRLEHESASRNDPGGTA
jgi:hypothetical protein